MKHTIHTLPILLAASALAQTAPAPAPAKSDWTQTHNLALATDYIFRGLTQIDGDGIALSGGTDVAHSSGFSFGVWAANQTWTDDMYVNASVGSGLELDVYAGYAKTLGDFTLSVGVISYHYEGAEFVNTTEAYVGVAAYGLSVKYSSSLTDYFGVPDSDGVAYLSFGYTLEIPGVKDLSLGLNYGLTTAESTQDGYSDYKVSLSYPVAGYTASVAYTDVDGFSGIVKDTFTFSLSRTF